MPKERLYVLKRNMNFLKFVSSKEERLVRLRGGSIVVLVRADVQPCCGGRRINLFFLAEDGTLVRDGFEADHSYTDKSVIDKLMSDIEVF